MFPWEELTEFQRLMLIKILRADTLMSSIHQYVHNHMGHKFVSSGGFDLKELYDESSAKTPLIFILSPGKYDALLNCQHVTFLPSLFIVIFINHEVKLDISNCLPAAQQLLVFFLFFHIVSTLHKPLFSLVSVKFQK